MHSVINEDDFTFFPSFLLRKMLISESKGEFVSSILHSGRE